jgi:tetratricopeptide (TPR) repeat protein
MVLGWPDRGLEMARDGVRLARNRGHAFDIEWALQAFGANNNWLHRFAEAAEAAEALAEAHSICEQHGFESHRGISLLQFGIAKIGLGDTVQGSADFDQGYKVWAKATGPIHLTQYLARVADVCVVRREFDLVERYLANAKAVVGTEDERTYSAELLRLGGLLCNVHGQRRQAISMLHEAIAVADAQAANGFKLRAARDLGRLLAEDGDVEGARKVLAPVYAWFTEGFETP